MEFWSELLTKASWEKLLELSKDRDLDFMVIGGWAAYLWTGVHKSKDIDIIVDHDTLLRLRRAYDVEKNDGLKTYEIKLEKFDIDIYLPGYSKLALPVDEIMGAAALVKGIKVPKTEVLLILKQGAEIERRGSVKGKKDAIDMLTLLIHSDLDLEEYRRLLERHGMGEFVDQLTAVVRDFSDRDIPHLAISFTAYKKWKRDILAKLKRL